MGSRRWGEDGAIGSLLLGYYDGAQLVSAGTGRNAKTVRDLWERLSRTGGEDTTSTF